MVTFEPARRTRHASVLRARTPSPGTPSVADAARVQVRRVLQTPTVRPKPALGQATKFPAGRRGWPTGLQRDLESAYQVSLQDIPLMIDSSLSRDGAAAAADGVGVRVHPRWFDPDSGSGRHLIAHEVGHLVQQSRGVRLSTSEQEADSLAGRFVRERGPLLGPTRLHPRPQPMLFKTAVDAAKDTIRTATAGWGTDEAAIIKALQGLTPQELSELSADAPLMRLLVDELSGEDLTKVANLLAAGRVGGMSRAQLATITADPSRYSFGVLAAAQARDVLLQHQEAQTSTGTGTIQGSHCPTPLPGSAQSADCTTYVLDTLRAAFAAKGQAATWARVSATARAVDPNLKGTELIKALQAEAGWEAVFWAPDPRNPADTSSEHPAAYKTVRERGSYYGIAVDQKKSVIEFRRTSSAAKQDLSGIERLRRLPFGVLATRGGQHMALIVNGSVYEVHWDKPATDPNAIEATPLESWAWLSGVIAAPKGELDLAWGTP